MTVELRLVGEVGEFAEVFKALLGIQPAAGTVDGPSAGDDDQPAKKYSVDYSAVSSGGLSGVASDAVLVNAPDEAPKPAIFSEEDVATATIALAREKGMDAATSLLGEFKIERARELTPELRGTYILRAKELQSSASE